jgi:predicted HTH domain antitoxin
MTLGVQLPEDIALRLEACWRDMPRRALEAIAVEGYRSGALTRAEVGRLLEFSYWETEAFLKERQAYLPYDEADLDHDREALDKIQSE